MPARRLVLQHVAFLVGLGLALGAAHASEPSSDAPLEPIVELNKRALLAYQMLDVAGAAELLSQALALCEQAKLANHPVAARTLIHLGAVQVAGLKQPAEGIASFRRALAIDPNINVTQSLQNPEVESAFDQAKTGQPAPSSPVAEARSAAPPPVPSRRLNRSINHPPVTRAIRGRPVTIKVQVPPGLAAFKVMLAYRAADSDEFLVRRMFPLKEVPGWFAAEIPLEATQGAHVAYYLEAQNLDDQPIATSGTPDLPHTVALTPEAATEEIAPTPANKSTAQPAASGPGGLWLVLALGSGGGYHSGAPEMNPHDASTPPQAIHVSGFGMAGLGHLAPEIGYFANQRLVISVQGRLQYVTGTQEVTFEHREYHPAKLALAGLVKLSWLMRDQKRLRPFVSAQVGAGQIRHGITTPASANLTGCGDEPTCKDTVVGGPGLAGIGAGLAWMLRSGFGLYAGLNVLTSFPDFLVNADLNLGIVVLR
jgi:hypothetical protein